MPARTWPPVRFCGARLQQLAAQQGHTPASLAAVANLPAADVWRLARADDVLVCHVTAVVRLAQVLATSCDYLLGLTDTPTPYPPAQAGAIPLEMAALGDDEDCDV